MKKFLYSNKKAMPRPAYRQAGGRQGMTIVELLIVIAIISIITLISLPTLFKRRSQNDLINTTEQIVSILREARTRSVSQSSSTNWGVRLGNPTTTSPFYALYARDYGSTTTIGYYKLPPTLVYATSNIPSGSYLDITFSQISGDASASTSVTIYVGGNSLNSSTISVASSGAVSF